LTSAARGAGWVLLPIEARRRWRHAVDVTLFWRVFVINAGVLVLATVALALSPATVSPDLRRSCWLSAFWC
jgi:hypothetical protein